MFVCLFVCLFVVVVVVVLGGLMHTRLFECFCNLPNSVRVRTGDTAGLCGLFHSSQLLSLCQSPYAVAEVPRWTVCSVCTLDCLYFPY